VLETRLGAVGDVVEIHKTKLEKPLALGCGLRDKGCFPPFALDLHVLLHPLPDSAVGTALCHKNRPLLRRSAHPVLWCARHGIEGQDSLGPCETASAPTPRKLSPSIKGGENEFPRFCVEGVCSK
jgi:hypothetical protein